MRQLFVVLILAVLGSAMVSCAMEMHKPIAATALYAADAATVPPPPESSAAAAAPLSGEFLGVPAKGARRAAFGGGGSTSLALAESESAGGQAPKSAATPAPKPSNRKVIYTGTLTLQVANKTTGREEVDKVIKKYDGFILSGTLDEVIFRVAPEKFEAAMNELALLGEVSAREIKSEDVTAQFFDLTLRIDVAEGSRKRLMELLGKSGTVKDVLEVERDLRRLTEEIESLKGVLRKMQDQIDLATITVRLAEKRMVEQPRRHSISSIFAWLNGVGLDRVLTRIPDDATLHGEWSLRRLFQGAPFRLATGSGELLPAGFLPVYYDATHLLGATPQDNRLSVQLFKLRQSGDLGFWADALSEECRTFRGYIVRAREEVKLTEPGLKAVRLRCETAIGTETWSYDVWLIQRAIRPQYLYVVEYARVKKQAEEHLPAIEESVRGIEIRRLIRDVIMFRK